MRVAAVCSFRLGGGDGVSVEAAKWCGALGRLGYRVVTVAGAGAADRIVPGLALDAANAPDASQLEDALHDADLVVVENLCSLPMNPAAAAAVARSLTDRPAVLRHHDLPWQRPWFADRPPPPDDPAWLHVTINDLSRRQLAERGIAASTLPNHFDPDPPLGDRDGTRERLGIVIGQRLLLQPTRALGRKNVPGGVALAASIDATYWLLGPAEDGYDRELAEILGAAGVPVRRGPAPGSSPDRVVADAYAAADAVTLPSTWEGFGNPAIESATHRRPLAIGPYPVAAELAAHGFRWFSLDGRSLGRFLDDPDVGLLEHNHTAARRAFSLDDLPARLGALLERLPPSARPPEPMPHGTRLSADPFPPSVSATPRHGGPPRR